MKELKNVKDHEVMNERIEERKGSWSNEWKKELMNVRVKDHAVMNERIDKFKGSWSNEWKNWRM